MTLHIRNPHSVLAALETRPRDVLQIIAPPGALERGADEGNRESNKESKDAWAKVMVAARAKGIPITQGVRESGGREGVRESTGRDAHARGFGGRGGSGPRDNAPGKGPHSDKSGGRLSVAEALINERPGLSSEELFRGAKDRAGGKGLWLALDSLTDPHNVGAIFRAASFFGVQGIIMTQDRSAPLTSAVYDVACGGLEYVPFAVQANLQRAFEVAKDNGLWILGTSEHAKQSFRKIERDRPWLLVVGNEERGMRRLTEESCDLICQIPPVGKVTSLNVSVASGILISALTAGE